jgi:glycosyltransferase involved in cell wall biosynthesis
LKKIYFTVTNDLSFDQRMARICNSLANAGYSVCLIGRRKHGSIALEQKKYDQKRLRCLVNSGPLFYAEYNLRLFLYLLFKKMDALCAIDLDTILPVLLISRFKKVSRIYDAHELFCEMKEVVTRPATYLRWKRIEKFAVPKFMYAYTVSEPIAEEFFRMYGVRFELIRNVPLLEDAPAAEKNESYVLYQGAVNEGRSFETLIPAMKAVEVRLIVCGDGNFMEQARALTRVNSLEEKIIFKGMLSPAELKNYTRGATIGITLFENNGLSNYYSLANRFFDYIQAGIPQVCVDYPAYQQINGQFKVAILISDLSPESVAAALNKLIKDPDQYRALQSACLDARKIYNWQEEEKKLLAFYRQVFP